VPYFRALLPLLLIHGHYSYTRTCLVAQYSYYKSFLFCCMQILFGFYSNFSGSSLFNSLAITSYNALLFFPIVTFICDKDVPMDVAKTQPVVYRHGVRSHYFNPKTFALWLLRGFLQSLVVYFCTIAIRGESYHMSGTGDPSEYEGLGMFAFFAYLWVQAITMHLELRNVTAISVFVIWLLHFFTFFLLWVTNISMSFNSLNGYYAVTVLYGNGDFWLGSLLICGLALVPVVAIQAYKFNYFPSLSDYLRRVYAVNPIAFTSKANLLMSPPQPSKLRLNPAPFDEDEKSTNKEFVNVTTM